MHGLVVLTDRCTRRPVHCSAWPQRVKHTEWETCPGGSGRVWRFTYRDTDSAPRRLAQYTTTFSLAALGDGMDYPEQGLGDQDWCHVTLTRSANYSIRMQQQEGWTWIHTGTHAGSGIGTSASCESSSAWVINWYWKQIANNCLQR